MTESVVIATLSTTASSSSPADIMKGNNTMMTNEWKEALSSPREDNHSHYHHQTLQSTSSKEADSHKEEEVLLTRPILVGYAFGPKKMSTMGVVMAEASKTMLSSIATTVLVEEDEAEDGQSSSEEDEHGLLCGVEDTCHDNHLGDEEDQADHHLNPPPSSISHENDQSLSLPLQYASPSRKNSTISRETDADVAVASHVASLQQGPPSHALNNNKKKNGSTEKRSSTPRRRRSRNNTDQCQLQDNEGNVVFSLDSYHGGLKNIVRYLHSSCSSVDTNSTTTTLLTTGTTVTAVTTMASNNNSNGVPQQQRLRVSFVPLDPDNPLEGQHGAKMDIILHKLTEDILCLSKYSHRYPELVKQLGGPSCSLHHPDLPLDAQEAILRVHRLIQYQRNHPECSLVDDPSKVLTLMSRSDIANALAGCLGGVTSASGVPVASPKFVVWDPSCDTMDITERTTCIAQRLCQANMSYPLIAKPLTAAGTKKSHQMTVLLNASSLEHVQDAPCLLQEYANHDAVLYKVYVLGNNVHVYQRPSLPNLPPLTTTTNTGLLPTGGHTRRPSYVDFDSQRPYPHLSAFGVSDGKDTTDLFSSLTLSSSSSSSSTSATANKSAAVPVTSDEVQPIVDALKQAFGLELFGFDILIASGQESGAPQKQMLVVDVNYFPSYKEVNNFPALLAQYLTQRAIDSRRGQQQEP